MRQTLLLSVFFFLLQVFSTTQHDSIIPKNIVQEYIKRNANFSVDPCVDFYAHACPTSSEANFFQALYQKKQKIAASLKKSQPGINYFDPDATSKNAETIVKLISSGKIGDLCLDPKTKSLMTQFGHQFLTPTPGAINSPTFKKMSCEEKTEFLKTLQNVEHQYITIRHRLSSALDALFVNIELEELDEKMRSLFEKLRKAVSTAIKRTTWAWKRHAVSKFVDAVLGIKFTTYADLQNRTMDALKNHNDMTNNCRAQFNESSRFEEKQIAAICDVIATGSSYFTLSKRLKDVYYNDMETIFEDRLNAFNSEDDHIYMGNDMMLLMNTDYLSDMYGSIGFAMIHEIMHTLVFDDLDQITHKEMASLWTNSSKCVEEQNRKTCATFPTVPCGHERETFEEDAADMAAYRIVYDLYRKAYDRKMVVENYEALDKRQLFFYGAAVLFCSPSGMMQRTSASGSHMNSYQRVNSMMSQMDEFADAFHCKPSDKMVRNKARHCELYGRGASMTRKNSILF